MAEALLPDTDAIQAGVLEWNEYRGKWLVRYKEPVAPFSVQRVQTASWSEANTAFEKFLADLKSKISNRQSSMTK